MTTHAPQFLNDEGENSGDGFYCLLDSSLESATAMAETDSMHQAGVRTAHVRLWMVKKFDESEVCIYVI